MSLLYIHMNTFIAHAKAECKPLTQQEQRRSLLRTKVFIICK